MNESKGRQLLLISSFVLHLWICALEVGGATETVLNEPTTPITENFTYRSEENGITLTIVHTSKNKVEKDSQNLNHTSDSSEGFNVDEFNGASKTEPTDVDGSSTSLESVTPYNLTLFASNSPLTADENVKVSNATVKFSKDEDLVNKIRYYLKYVDSFDLPKLGFSPENRRVFDDGNRKKTHKRLAFLDKMLEDYDRRAWPTYGTDKPTAVTVNIYINTLGPVNAAQMEYDMDIYLRQMWNDPRLQLSRYGVNKRVTLNAEDIVQYIWKPDIFFRNVKHASFHEVTVPNKLIKIQPNGDVLYSMRITMKLACHMSFRHYPLDRQHCQIILGSYAQTTDQVIIQWQKRDPINTEKQPLELPEFEVAGMAHSSFVRAIDTGAFSFLNVTFLLVRQNGFHLIQTYMPTFLIVMISWVSFWLNVDATPARVTLGVTTLLTLTTVAYGVRMQLPPVSYIKAIDIWIGACSVMVFGALLEFTLVNYLSRSKFKPAEFKNSINIFHWNKKLQMAQDIEGSIRSPEDEIARNLKRARYVDRFCRIIFPVAFLIFNIAYWLYYLYVPDNAA